VKDDIMASFSPWIVETSEETFQQDVLEQERNPS
jgi:hypothetical protein